MKHPARKIIRALGLGAFPFYAVCIGRAFYEGFSRVVTWCGLPVVSHFPHDGTTDVFNWAATVSAVAGFCLAGWVAATISDLTEPDEEEEASKAAAALAALKRNAAALTPAGAAVLATEEASRAARGEPK